MIFFTPIISFRLNRLDNGEEVWFHPGTLHFKTSIEGFCLYGACPGYTLDEKIEYLKSKWIKTIEPTDMHEVIKVLLLTQKGE